MKDPESTDVVDSLPKSSGPPLFKRQSSFRNIGPALFMPGIEKMKIMDNIKQLKKRQKKKKTRSFMVKS